MVAEDKENVEQALLDFVEVALRHSTQSGSRQFKVLLTSLQSNDSAALTRWFKALSKAAGSISTNSKVVPLITQFQWSTHTDETLIAFSDLLVNMCCCNGVFVIPCLSNIVDNLTSFPFSTEGEGHSPEVEKTMLRVFEHMHRCVHRMMSILPSITSSILPLLCSRFPYHDQSATEHLHYLRNLLRIAEYAPQLRDPLIHLIIMKCVDLDALMSNCSEAESRTIQDKLDSMFYLLLQYFQLLHSGDNAFLKDLSRSVFCSLLRSFESVILRTHNCRTVQFLLFYYCSFNPLYSEVVLKRLVEHFLEPTESVQARKVSILYLASFMTRSKFLRFNTLLHYWNILLSWTLAYSEEIEQDLLILKETDAMDEYEDLMHPGRHILFYSACNAVFYIAVHCSDRFFNLIDPDTMEEDDYDLDCIAQLLESPLNIHIHCDTGLFTDFISFCSAIGIETPILPQTQKLKQFTLGNLPFDHCTLPNTSTILSSSHRSNSALKSERSSLLVRK